MLSSPRRDIFALCCCHCVQQKRPNQNILFACIFIGPGLVGQEEGFCSVKDSISQSEDVLDSLNSGNWRVQG